MKRLVFCISILAVAGLLDAQAPADPIRLTVVSTAITDPAAARAFDAALAGAADRANRTLEEEVFVRERGNGGTGATVEVSAVNDGSQRLVSLTLARPDGTQVPVTVFAPWDGFLERVLVATLRYLHAGAAGFPAGELPPPRLVDELPAMRIESPSARLAQVGVYPFSLTVRPNGNLVVGGSTFAVELDPLFRVVDYPGSALLEDGIFNYAYQTAGTPADTLFFRGSTGGEIYRIVAGVPRAQRLRSGLSGTGSFTALRDGSVVVTDSVNRRAVRIAERRPQPLALHTHESAYIATVAAGPAGGIWAFDTVERRIIVFTADGRAVDTIMPHLPPENLAGTVGIAVYEDRSFVLLTRSGLWKLAPDGSLLWHLSEVPNDAGSSFAQAMGIALDSQRGFIYVADPLRRTVSRFIDPTVAEPAGVQARLAAATAEVARVSRNGGDPLPALRSKARLYEEIGAPALAEAGWQRVLDIDPFDPQAAEGLARAEMTRLEARAERLAAETRRVLEEFGQESARSAYSQALQAYERIRSLEPDRRGVDDAIRRLRRDFDAGGEPDLGEGGLLRVARLEVDNLFPSLSTAYRRQPVGFAVLENTGDRPLREVTAELELPRYGDYPVAADPVEELPPGGTARLPLRLALNTEVFRVEEDLPVQVRLTARARAGGERVESSRTTSTTLYRRTALTWDETEKLAAFVTPNEGNVQRFTLAVSRAENVGGDAEANLEGFSTRIAGAARIVDALGLHGIAYVEDPDTPISRVLGRTGVVDTVRFPRTTLLYRAGDCDDTTVLLASLLEAAGIATAVITTPDHVLLAFDTGEPASRAWLFEDDRRRVFRREGRVWIPVETTVLADGFLAAWEAASARIRRAGGLARAGFVAVAEAWDAYPSLSVPATELNLLPPDPGEREQAAAATAAGLETALYDDAAAALEAELGRLRGDRRLRALNRLAMLHGRFGREEAARAALREALEVDPDAAASRVNLANLALAAGDYAEARRVLLPAHERRPESVVIHALLARVERELGNRRAADRHADLVRRRDPDLARRYALLDTDTGARAAAGPDGAALVWPESPGDL